MPRIKARFRRRYGVPYAIEMYSGKQFRCRHCNQIFWREKELDTHLQLVAAEKNGKPVAVHREVPALSSNLTATVIYTYDIEDRVKKQWLKLKKGEEYDGP